MSDVSKYSASELAQLAKQIQILAHQSACDELAEQIRRLGDGSGSVAALGLAVGQVLGLMGHQCTKFKEWLLTKGMDGLRHIYKIVDKLRAVVGTFRTAAQVGARVVELLGAESKELSE